MNRKSHHLPLVAVILSQRSYAGCTACTLTKPSYFPQGSARSVIVGDV